jgi:hypothetical protein
MLLTFATAHLFECGFVPKGVFSRLHDKGEPSRDGLSRLGGFRLLGGGHECCRDCWSVGGGLF